MMPQDPIQPTPPARIHGGPDAAGVARWDFSTSANACGPCPQALAAVQGADPRHYPDPAYTALRAALARLHGVAQGRVVLAGSASEFIFRVTAWAARQGAAVWWPSHCYGDYPHAAQAWGLQRCPQWQQARLLWACEPSSPLGQAHSVWPNLERPYAERATVVLDCAYAPLRLSGAPSLSDAQLQQVWRLYSPNKALGLTGVRAAYAIAPVDVNAADVHALQALAPSWVLGAHGVALLQAWCESAVQQWVAQCLPTLRQWKAAQQALLAQRGWEIAHSEANYFCARPPVAEQDLAPWLQALRAHGVRLRDATSFGLGGWVRLGVLGPQAHEALACALDALATPERTQPSRTDEPLVPVP
ncbi:MAG: aminotransferase class I/II-fold pyridoxal phosphate-dependent enzyme [Rhodoferax sp.]